MPLIRMTIQGNIESGREKYSKRAVFTCRYLGIIMTLTVEELFRHCSGYIFMKFTHDIIYRKLDISDQFFAGYLLF